LEQQDERECHDQNGDHAGQPNGFDDAAQT
jgi:hypothetical protein